MFDSSYPLQYRGAHPAKTHDIFHKLHLFTFRDAKRQRYIIEVEAYSYHLYGIKFYLKANRLSANRYSLTTNYYDASRILGTCLMAMEYITDMDEFASFGFIGSPLLAEQSLQQQNASRCIVASCKTYFRQNATSILNTLPKVYICC